MVKWFEYICFQCQKKIFNFCLKVFFVIVQFQQVFDKNIVVQVFKFFNKYCFEIKVEKKECFFKEVIVIKEGKKKEDVFKKFYVVKYGFNYVVGFIENKKVFFVFIFNDVDFIEFVIFFFVFCCKMGVFYVIIKGKVRFGIVVYKKVCFFCFFFY